MRSSSNLSGDGGRNRRRCSGGESVEIKQDKILIFKGNHSHGYNSKAITPEMKIFTLILNRVGGGEGGGGWGGGGPLPGKTLQVIFLSKVVAIFFRCIQNLSLTIKISFCPIFFLHKSLVSWLNQYYFISCTCTTFLSKIFYKCCKNAILSSTSFPRSDQTGRPRSDSAECSAPASPIWRGGPPLLPSPAASLPFLSCSLYYFLQA